MMDAVGWVNAALAVLSIGFGALALFWPRYALGALHLQTVGGRADGMSELRGASGGAFVVIGLVALALWQPMVWVMMGVHYAGAGVGRLLSIMLDGAGSPKMWAFFAIEAVFAAWLIGANWPG